ncbi:class I SAM-dependent methyltransferase [Bordetella avium]|uniref:class I SAM-dependent methyltransferase n=1 Tax=Bordetella avium TaxID=521 RepID=UPI0002FABA1F|nr:class I SAM-dependent methyltransferase [Bordetella avium]AZY50289.1 class I SAM-dependent methyltransferase [Bordetella avium]AZY53683.1 class I SAM-dependent methyltransferase [Bordetella avium]RIQ15543.1 class I SAM-dependent methyltransferase [Bordetella avium]RIQ19651.1 class I SAM-dependent methyltransferase [Bordetella avium]RIQ34231.1 class I SAM-dependent methyltransferase [Bordetella avium]
MAETTAPIVELAEWFQTPPGKYALAWERARFDEEVADVFGYYAWQMGLADPDLLANNRMPFKAWVGADLFTSDTAWPARVQAQPELLPFESQSVDLLVLPHMLECAEAPHEVLREVERVLVPEGRVVISGFNPWSLWGVRNALPGMEAWLPVPLKSQVSLPRLRDWLKLLSFEVDRGHYGCFIPACRNESWIKRWHFMEGLGKRWWRVGGAVYVVSAVKRVSGMRLIGPAWKKKRKAAQGAPVGVSRQSDSP